jgi:BASS family bile acid:Na+ symporter
LIASYVLAACLPGPALGLRNISLGTLGSNPLNLPAILLAVLLFNAGFGIRFGALRHVRKSGAVLAAGTVANMVVPLLAIFTASGLLTLWHNSDQIQSILVGMALVASMPIAGSSTAWSQNAEGDLTVSLGLVLLSTSLSPFTTPLLLHASSWLTIGHYSQALRALAGQGTGQFLVVFVLVPSILGMITRALCGEKRSKKRQPAVKIANTIVLLVLCYMNAAVSLPRAVAHPDLDFLAMVILVTVALSTVTFGSGWLLAKLLRLNRAQTAPLVFGLGMANNGTGLVIATSALADRPLVLVPILFYNLIQHLAAGIADRRLFSPEPQAAQ